MNVRGRQNLGPGRSAAVWLTVLSFMIGFLLINAIPGNGASIPVVDAKRLADGAAVKLSNVVVTAAFNGVFYVADSNHNSGIRVVSNATTYPGQVADITGVMSTSPSFERQIIASSASFQVYDPPLVSNQEIGGGDYAYDPSNKTGQRGVPNSDGIPNNVGQLVKTSGTVMMGKPGDQADFPIDDGTHCALLVVLLPGMSNPGYSAKVTVTGISSLQYQAGVTRRAILVRTPQDLQIDAAPPECKYTDPMVYIPAGESTVGTDEDPNDSRTKIWSPKHTIWLDGYWIGKYEVTRAQYRKFIDAGGYDHQEYWTPEGWWWRLQFRTNKPEFWDNASWNQTEQHPVVGVSPFEMDAYCKWAGVRRVSEAEWEKAAGWDPVAQKERTYPWGDMWDPNKCNSEGNTIWPISNKTAPVGTFPAGASYYGCMDMAGNVFEWCRGYYSADWYNNPPVIGWINPDGANRPEYDFYGYQVYRGGSWASPATSVPTWYRFGQFPYLYNADIGFRVAR